MFCRIFFPRARWLELVVPDLPRRESRCSTLNVTKVQKEKYFDKDFFLLAWACGGYHNRPGEIPGICLFVCLYRVLCLCLSLSLDMVQLVKIKC